MVTHAEIQRVYQKLLSHYGPQGWWPLYNDKTGKIEYHPGDYSFPKNEQQSFEISVGAILTQNTSWKNVEKALQQLHKTKSLSREKLKVLPTGKLAKLIKSSGYHNQKAKKIKEFLKFDKTVTRQALLELWGIGPETADSILLYVYKQPVFVVDAYTRKVMSRLGFAFASYDELQQLFMMNVPNDYKIMNEFHALFVEHGKKICKAKPLCGACPLKETCNYFKRTRTSLRSVISPL